MVSIRVPFQLRSCSERVQLALQRFTNYLEIDIDIFYTYDIRILRFPSMNFEIIPDTILTIKMYMQATFKYA